MEEYVCLECGRAWKTRVTSYRDWKRRKCSGCGKRRTVKQVLFKRAVEEFATSLRLSPPPFPPRPSAVSAVFSLLAETFPGSSPVRVLWDVYREAQRQAGREGQACPKT